jgi:dienelactone hydrolase
MLQGLRRSLCLALLAAAGCCVGCGYRYFADHYLVYPDRRPPGVTTWSDDVAADRLLIHVKGARPIGDGPFPAVIVLPEGGKTADDMQGVAWDLAAHGYAAIAADYERRVDGSYRRSLFAWRSPADATAIVDVARTYAAVDPGRIGLLGFSQGGVYSLLIAAYAPDRINAVVSYYPVTDFPHWLDKREAGFWQRFAFRFVRWYFRRESGAENEAEFEQVLTAASPYFVAEKIEAPVLLIHGERDTTAPVEESQRMADRLAALGKPVDLLVISGAVHIFNFRQPREAAVAREATMQWFDRYLCGRAADSQRAARPRSR